MIQKINPKSIVSTVTFISEKDNSYKAAVSFHCQLSGVDTDDTLCIIKNEENQVFFWNKKSFPPGLMEYLELRAQIEVDNELLLKQSDFNI
jgi:hypothetical protein